MKNNLKELQKLRETIINDIESANAIGISSEGYHTEKTFVAWNPRKQTLTRGKRQKIIATEIDHADFQFAKVAGIITYVAFIIRKESGGLTIGIAKIKKSKEEYEEYLKSKIDPRD